MGATAELASAGDTRPTVGKTCRSCTRQGEWPGQPCPECKDGGLVLGNKRTSLDPLPLHELAEHLRDQRWLDMRVDDGRGTLVKRVRFTSVIVRVEDELVTCRQEWVGGTEEEPEFKHQNLVFDADAIWRALPTVFDLEELLPYGVPHVPVSTSKGAVELSVSDQIVMDTIINTISQTWGHERGRIRKFDNSANDTQIVWARYNAMLLLYDMTQLSGNAICDAFGYASPTAIICARQEIELRANQQGTDHYKTAQNRRNLLRDIAKQVDQQLTAKHRRKPDSNRYFLDVPD